MNSTGASQMQNEERMQKIEQQVELIKSKVDHIFWAANFFMLVFVGVAIFRIIVITFP
jgi:hypothetical protein